MSKAKALVLRLQIRIAKAEREGRPGKVKALQRLLTTSFYGRYLAVKRVTSSKGKNTLGVDGVILRTPGQKFKAVNELKRMGYTPSPLRRIHIPKKSGKLRPLSIPTLKDRCMQAIWHAALVPVAEERADKNAYGFRPKRSTHDAIEQCFIALSRKRSATLVLEGDIKACFDRIDHNWLLKNIPMDKTILKKFLKAGFMENEKCYPTDFGVPQGGVISTTLAVMALSGIESKLVSTSSRQRNKEKINIIAYADDFVVTAASEQLLKEKVIPTLMVALKEVGLELSPEKTRITSIEKGFDFLGFNIRKYRCGKLLIKPSKANIKSFLKEIKGIIRTSGSLTTETLIHRLNQKITGWTNYYRSVVSSKVFSKVDSEIFLALNRWVLKRHPTKGTRWITEKYYTSVKGNRWRFHCVVKDKEGKEKNLYLKQATDTHIRRHTKIKAEANPFDPRFKEYFKERAINSKAKST
ncbi:MAG: group II intron reverse transcriptase/maturase [Tatlockia sp.]|nr:group II intron reverse transcriptase/maturase [Tatlockia sp.]